MLMFSWYCQTALLSSSTLPSSQFDHKTALMLAAENGHLETVTKLIEAGASVDALTPVSAIVIASIDYDYSDIHVCIHIWIGINQ